MVQWLTPRIGHRRDRRQRGQYPELALPPGIDCRLRRIRSPEDAHPNLYRAPVGPT